MRGAIAATTVGVLALSLAACSTSAEGTEGPEKTGVPSRSAVPSIARAPEVAEPLTPDPFLSDACRAISADTAAALNLATPGNGDRTPASSGCVWRTVDRQFTVAVSRMTTLTAGLSEIYAQWAKDPEVYRYFEPLVVRGYPALYADKIDKRARGHCTLNIGVTDSLYVKISVNRLARGENVCELAAAQIYWRIGIGIGIGNGPGNGDLAAAQEELTRLEERCSAREGVLRDLAAELDAAWQGNAADSAVTTLAPLNRAFQDATSSLQQLVDAVRDQIESFSRIYHAVEEVPAEPGPVPGTCAPRSARPAGASASSAR
ncbi:DUF3558 domain-containing protein [Actinosynnema sp. CA-299493]